jgi:leucyl aminopeptidase
MNRQIEPPRVIADRARELGKRRIVCRCPDEQKIRELKTGALLGVSQEARSLLGCTEVYGEPGSSKMLAYVGKGVTFDTGISPKSADGMEKIAAWLAA